MPTELPKVITRHAVNTIWFDKMSTAMAYKLPLAVQPFTTLNEDLNINKTLTLPANTYPSVGYFAIGSKGHTATVVTNAQGGVEDVNIDTLQHTPTHSGMYEQKPFVIRPKNSDLSTADRAKYALRKLETIGGIEYYCYYLKRLDLTAAEVSTSTYTEANGIEVITPFVPDASSLRPVPILPNSTTANALLGTYIKNVIKYTIVFTAQDVQEYTNACAIKGTPATNVKLSELAICQGQDQNVTIDNNGVNTNMNEAIAVQIAHFVPLFEMVKFSTLGFNVVISVGMNRTMFTPEQVTSTV